VASGGRRLFSGPVIRIVDLEPSILDLMRIALGLEYDGGAFHGWQSQADGGGVQDALERALSTIAGETIRTIAAGRTDAGVHATIQVAHFDTEATRPETAWVRGVNALLPESIAVRWALPIDESFHARFAATGRGYTYLLLDRPVRPALYAGRVGWYHRPLAVEAMRAEAESLLGSHDFSAFRAAECQAKSPIKRLDQLSVDRHDDMIRFEFHADAFLQHMVRNIVGALVYVGDGRQSSGWMKELLESRDRARGAPTFAAAGLYLTGIDYPGRWNLPATLVPVRLPSG
jgi:tRNA pseudouridine38-40 synthase